MRFPEPLKGAHPMSGPPWRIRLLLAALVLLAHALVLGTAPSHFGPALAPASTAIPAMVTRTIALAQPAPAGTPPAQAARQPAPALKKKAAPPQPPAAPPAHAPQESAPDSAVNAPSIDPPEGSHLAAAPSPSTQTTPAEPDTSTSTSEAAAATPAASAPAAPPAAPGQTPVTAMALPASVEMGYQITGSVKGLTYHAKGELLWRHRDGSYDVRMTVSALFVGSRSMASQGQINAQGLAPKRFSDRSRTEVAAHFEPEKGQVSFSANTPSVPWVQGGQDRASVFIQLGGMLAGNPAGFPAGASISVYTVGPRDADTWTFQVEGEEMLSLPFGQLATLKLSRQLRHDNDQKLEVWYAPSLGYLPVRNKITQTNGDFVDQQLSTASRP